MIRAVEWITLLILFFQAANAADGDLFNYDATILSTDGSDGSGNSYGPTDWDKVSCDDLETCPGWPEKWVTGVDWSLTTNHCKDCQDADSCGRHHQSPIDLKRSWGFNETPDDAHECIDGHWMEYLDGTCTWDNLKATHAFSIERHALRIGQPLEQIPNDGGPSSYRLNCASPKGERKFPRIDFAKGFSELFFLSHTEIKVPSEHTQDGIQYDAEVQLPHFFSVSAEENGGKPNQMGTIAIFLQQNETYAPYPYLDKVICQFRHVEDQVRQACEMESVTTHYPGCYNHNRTWSSRKLETTQDVNRSLQSSHNAALDRMLNNDKATFSLELDPLNFEDGLTKEEWSGFVQDYSRQHPLNQEGQDVHHDIDYKDVEHRDYQWLLDVRTEYYFRYGGTMTIPPCYGEFIRSRAQTNNWRVMKDPIRVHPRQIDELHRLLRERIAPPDDLNTKARCKADTAAKIYPDGKVSVARPIQELSFSHYNRFCECKDWGSQWPEDQKWCHSGNEAYRFFENRYNEANNENSSCTLGNFLASPNTRVQGADAVLMPSSIMSGDTIQSPTVKAFLYQRNDGNLMIIYGDSADKAQWGEVLWESGMSLTIGSYISELSNQGKLTTRRVEDDTIVWSTDSLNENLSVSHWFALDCDWNIVGIYEGRWDIPGNVVWQSAPLAEYAFGAAPRIFEVPFHASALDFTDFVDSDEVHQGTCSEGPVDAKPTNDYVCKSRGSLCTVAWIRSGEELTYAFTSNNSEQMLVDVILRVSSESPKRGIYVEIDSIQKGQSFLTNGGGWDHFEDYVWTTTLWSGRHNLRVKFVKGSVNLCSVSVMMKDA